MHNTLQSLSIGKDSLAVHSVARDTGSKSGASVGSLEQGSPQERCGRGRNKGREGDDPVWEVGRLRSSSSSSSQQMVIPFLSRSCGYVVSASPDR